MASDAQLALLNAIMNGEAESLEEIVRRGADVNAVGTVVVNMHSNTTVSLHIGHGKDTVTVYSLAVHCALRSHTLRRPSSRRNCTRLCGRMRRNKVRNRAGASWCRRKLG